jgi:hypothetical protein
MRFLIPQIAPAALAAVIFVGCSGAISTPGAVHSASWSLSKSLSNAPPTATFTYGNPNDIPVAGDWNGDGVMTPGVVRNGVWYLSNDVEGKTADYTFTYGNPGDRPVVGDWDGSGTDTPGVVRENHWYLRNSNSAGPSDVDFAFGNAGDIPVAGDWNGDKVDTPGVVRSAHWYLRNENSAGASDLDFVYGNPGDLPVVGDWNGDKIDSPGVVRSAHWYVRNSNSAGASDEDFVYGTAADTPLPGKWGTFPANAPPPVATPAPCTPGGANTITILEFASPHGNSTVLLGDPLVFQITASRDTLPGGFAPAVVDGQTISFQFNGPGTPSQNFYALPVTQIVTPQNAGTVHTLSFTGPCGTVSTTAKFQGVAPTVPQVLVKASSTYVKLGTAVTLTTTIPVFRPTDCQAYESSIVGSLSGTGTVVFRDPHVKNSQAIVNPTADTSYTDTVTCANTTPVAGTPMSTTSTVVVTIGPNGQQQSGGSYFCFKVTTPASGICFTEAVAAANAGAAEALENAANPGATVDALGACTSVPDACGG